MPRLVLSLVFLALMAPIAHADLIVCNRTDARVGVAIGYRDTNSTAPDPWVTEGWWNLTPDTCRPLMRGPLNARYYYVYGFNYMTGSEWTDRFEMCTQADSFTIRGRENCATRGMETRGFMEVDTLEETRWVIELSNPDS